MTHIADNNSLKSSARILITSGDFDQAVSLLSPDNIKLLWELGEEFLSTGNLPFTLMCWRKVVQHIPHDQYLQITLIRTLFNANQKDEALAVAEKFNMSVPPINRSDLTSEEKLLFCLMENIAIVTPEGAAALVRLTDYVVRNNIPGAFVECGVYKGGGVAIMMHALLARFDSEREFYLFDTFSGMPKPGESDVYTDGRSANDEWLEKRRPDGQSGWVNSTIEETRALVEKTGYPKNRIHYVQGMVEKTLPTQAPEQIALLRLDTDFYESTHHELKHLFPRLVHGGVLLIDDYGALQGCRLAVDEWLRESRLKLMLHRVDCNVRAAIKMG